MDYLFENLGDERFQEFCSCIISTEFPNMQAFPVGQPDGGRDTIVYEVETSPKKSFIVFQVKFVRNANEERDLHKWLTKTVENEAAKVAELAVRGAKSYYLITNVRGTAHLDSGSKDKVNSILESSLSIPAICWWRDDLARLIEKNPTVRWSFPEILNGQDVLNGLLFDQLNENKERRLSVLRAYLTDQYHIESEVKFKQIDLQNKLLTLFTDVPLKVKKIDQKNKKIRKTLGDIFNSTSDYSDDILVHHDDWTMGAADFLLHEQTQNQVSRILLEGGPGQGKSTITQYVCQVHRIKILRKSSDLSALPKDFISAQTRIPFKIDLRDIASWIEKKNPYKDALPQDYFDKIWRNSLESYLLSHIFYHSKIENFESSDLLAIIQVSPVLFVFDGFDEIADMELRQEVIDFINKGIQRLAANATSIQVIVTSRPAAFSGAVVFPVQSYPHFELTNVTPSIIDEYVGKWIKASRMQTRDANDLKRLVTDKLQMPHLRELAKSPMQLAIFITLLRTKGQSLPNKRTALFDSYISLFFDRESEKSSLVRDKRDLIIDIHQYLAWVLHSEAERFKKSGSIALEDLKIRLREYLSDEGHDPGVTDQLFDVMKERVCALVSRVQGTFEFEVQPLREYFCAKYLYTTAQNSTAGEVRPGTKPERLHAILRNPYWQNVVRFFAGCADAGELDMIIEELKGLQEDELLKYTHFPRIITSQILSDYVFTQRPKKMKEVVKIIINGINIGRIINESESSANSERLILPTECGRVEVVNECFEQLSRLPAKDYANELIGIINNNPHNDLLPKWTEKLSSFEGSPEKISIWLNYGYNLQLIHKIDEDILLGLLKGASKIDSSRRTEVVIDGNREEIFDRDLELKRVAAMHLIERHFSVAPKNRGPSIYSFLSILFNPYLHRLIFEKREAELTFIKYANQIFRNSNSLNFLEIPVKDEVDKLIVKFANDIENFLHSDIVSLQTSLDPWNRFLESARSHFGNTWNLQVIATVASKVRSREPLDQSISGLSDDLVSLCARARLGRLRSGNIKFWQESIKSELNQNFVLLIIFTWATPRVLAQLMSELDVLLATLTATSYCDLLEGALICGKLSPFSDSQQNTLIEAATILKVTDRLKYILSQRFKPDSGDQFVYQSTQTSKETPPQILHAKFNYLMRLFLKEPTSYDILKKTKDIYSFSLNSHSMGYYHLRHLERASTMPLPMAQEIMTKCTDYPRPIGAIAESKCRAYATANLSPVGEIAERDRWFE